MSRSSTLGEHWVLADLHTLNCLKNRIAIASAGDARTKRDNGCMNDRPPGVDVDLETHAGAQWARLTVENSRRLNVLNTSVLESFSRAIERLDDVDDLRWVVLQGAGDRAFIGGADIHEMVDLDPASAESFIRKIHDVCLGLRQLPVPVIARIDGFCFGAGLEIAAACDLRVASENSVFGMPEVQVGVPSVIEAALLPRLIGWGKTSELLLTGRRIDASRALEWGLVERVVPTANLDAVVQEWGDEIATASPRAVKLQKELMAKWEDLPLRQAIEAGVAAFAESFRTDEPRAAMQRFIDRPRAK